MNEQTALSKMVAPRQRRNLAPQFRGGVIQIWVTRQCDKACFGCTQGSNLKSIKSEYPAYITLDQFEQACFSLKDYFGIVGMFGGNPTVHPYFQELCEIMRDIIPYERRGLWCNKLFGKGAIARATFNPAVSNLNVHLDKEAYAEFRRDWPEAIPFGLHQDSRHAPPYVAMKDVIVDEEKRWELISGCDINQKWSAMIGVFRGELRAWFCEIAGAQAMLHQNDPNYPDTGKLVTCLNKAAHRDGNHCQLCLGIKWWQESMDRFRNQVRKHCHECGIPLRGHGMLSQGGEPNSVDQCSATHADVYQSKSTSCPVQLVTTIEQLQPNKITSVVDYLGNADK